MSQDILTAISDAVGTEVFGIWIFDRSCIGILYAGRICNGRGWIYKSKNAGNIIMKNLMDFCIGTCVFILIGFGLLLGEDALGGFIGIPTLGIFTNYAKF